MKTKVKNAKAQIKFCFIFFLLNAEIIKTNKFAHAPTKARDSIAFINSIFGVWSGADPNPMIPVKNNMGCTNNKIKLTNRYFLKTLIEIDIYVYLE
ncbi:hypothetical protein [Virgibacillus sp. DJP39]|uniref:hypothetical protein n=1 Tax=Virgibacillus sp. DJP39 TaxID=3409790 RepID=UPI003BB56A63